MARPKKTDGVESVVEEVPDSNPVRMSPEKRKALIATIAGRIYIHELDLKDTREEAIESAIDTATHIVDAVLK